jgi:hypothetical protein
MDLNEQSDDEESEELLSKLNHILLQPFEKLMKKVPKELF